jgi:hypothetical protein
MDFGYAMTVDEIVEISDHGSPGVSLNGLGSDPRMRGTVESKRKGLLRRF